MAQRQTLERQTPSPISRRTMQAGEINAWAREVAGKVAPDQTVTITLEVGDRRKRFDDLIAAMEISQAAAAKNGMTEADLDDILKTPI